MQVWRSLPLLMAAVAVAVAASTTKAMDTPCTAAKYADTYAGVKTQITACETASGVSPLELPLANKKKLLLCNACAELAALAKAKTLPTCTITQSNGESYTLRKQMTKIFNQCSVASDSGSGSDASSKGSVETTSTPTPTPTTTAVTPTVPTRSPTTTTKSSSTASNSTASTANSKSSATASSVAGEADDGVTPSASTTSKATTSAPSLSSTNASGTSNSKNDAVQQTPGNDKGSSLGVGVIAGVVVGVLVIVAVVVFIVMTKRRRKYDDAMPDSSRELTIDIPFHNAMRTVNLNNSTDNDNLMVREDRISPAAVLIVAAPVTQDHLWDDPLIVAARIPKDKVVATMLLSRGGFGEVYRGVYNGQQVAIKALLPETRKNMREINLFLIEVKLMTRLEHERIVQFVGVAWDSLTDLCVVTEYMEGGDLRDLLLLFEQAERPKGFDHDKIKIAMHVAHALTYMHSLQSKVLHRDLKSKNILLDTQMNAKLTDFGVSRERSDSTMTAGVGTSLWMAPEVMLGRRYDVKADIFSFGVVLSELDSHALPYANAKMKISRSKRPVTDSAVLKLISLGQLSVEFSASAPRELVDIAEACVAYDPKDRPSAADLLYMLHNVLRELHMSVSF